MNRWTKLLVFVFSFILLGVVALPLAAQNQGGQGGIIIDPNPNNGTDVATMNPLLTNDTYSAIVTGLLFPVLVGIDPTTADYAPGARGGLATSWDVSTDGKTITYHLRSDWNWSDGTPITAQDYIYGYNAIASGKTSSPRAYSATVIDQISAPDDHTLVITYKTAACTNISDTDGIVPIPSHTFQQQIGTDYSKMDKMDFNLNPTVTAGPFSFAAFQPGQQVSLQANQTYPDSVDGYVSPAGFIYKNVDDSNVALQQFLGGELNLIDDQASISPQNYPDLRTRTQSGQIHTAESLYNGYQWLAFNLSDPSKPVNGVDDKGNPVAQPPHPIFGDVRVRRALAKAVDVDAVIQGALFGEAVRTTSPAIASSWAFNPDLAPVPFDLATAKQDLAAAGWVDQNNDGILEAHGALYAPEGTPLKFSITTGAGDPTVVAVAQILQDQLKKVGADVTLNAIDFNTAVQQLVGQTFDTSVLAWNINYPDNPDFSFAFTPENDVVGGGFNFVSYNNPDVTQLLKQGSNVPGCDRKTRADFYHQARQKLVDDQPYIFLYTKKNMVAAAGNLQNFAPVANQLFNGVTSWTLSN